MLISVYNKYSLSLIVKYLVLNYVWQSLTLLLYIKKRGSYFLAVK